MHNVIDGEATYMGKRRRRPRSFRAFSSLRDVLSFTRVMALLVENNLFSAVTSYQNGDQNGDYSSICACAAAFLV